MNAARTAVLALLAAPLGGQIDPALLSGLKARSIGPAGMSGRVAALDAVVADPDVVYAGAATGGLWKSTNGGLTWEPLFDDQPVAAIGDVAVFQPSPDVVWVGTGEGNPRNSASVGNGVYRSLDGGRTWAHLGLEKSERIHRILLHPTDREVAWVAALGTTWGENEERGVFKTSDGGATWNKVLYVDERTGCADLVMDPRNPDKLFAAMWDHRRWPHHFRSGGPGSGLYVTHDGGQSWRRLTADDGLPAGELGRIGLAIARSDPRVVYALVEAKKSVLLRSNDGGRRFETVNRERGIANRPFYYADLRVDPADPKRVYSLASTVTVSDDGGKSFSQLSRGVHPDHHAMWIHPDDPTFLYEGNDGGVAISHDRGATWRFVTTLPLAQFYHLDVDMETPYNVYGGLQDNGSWRGPSSVWENGGIRNHHWHEVGFGDGFRTLADPEDATIGYAMSQQGFVHRWNLATGERKSIRPAPADAELRFNWNAAIAIDPFDPATIYFGSQFVHRSRDRGETWEVLSDDLTTNNPEWQKQGESGGLTLDVTGAENYTTILTIAPSPLQRGVLWVGTDDGRLWVSRDEGRSWNSVEANVPGVPSNTWIPHIEPSAFDAATAYVVFDDHRRSDWTTYVYRTTDFGASWKSLASEDLRGYALTLAQDPVDEDLLFLGTEFGLWFSVDGGGSWLPFRHGLPTVSCMALEVHPREHDLVVGTHGRAAYVVDDISPLRGLSAETMAKPLHLFAIPDAQQHHVAQTGASRFPGDGEFRGQNRPYGAMVTFVAGGEDLPHPDREQRRAGARGGDSEDDGESGEKGADETPRVKVEVRDERGERVCSFERPVVRGLNRISWNLRRDDFRQPRDDDDRRWQRGPGPRGPEVPPGPYTLRLTLGEEHAESTVRVRPDPRVAVSDEDRAAKWQAILETGRWQEQVTDAVERIEETRRDVGVVRGKVKRAQARHRDANADGEAPHQDLLDAAAALEKKLDAADARLRGPRDAQGIPPRDHVLAKIGLAARPLTSSWDAPTAAQRRYMEVARAALEPALTEVDELFAGDLAAFRARVEAAGIGLLQ